MKIKDLQETFDRFKETEIIIQDNCYYPKIIKSEHFFVHEDLFTDGMATLKINLVWPFLLPFHKQSLFTYEMPVINNNEVDIKFFNIQNETLMACMDDSAIQSIVLYLWNKARTLNYSIKEFRTYYVNKSHFCKPFNKASNEIKLFL